MLITMGNDYDNGIMIGRFFISWIINNLFCGFSLRIGKESDPGVYHITIQLGYGQLCIGITAE